MKKISILPLIAVLAITSCSQDDVIDNTKKGNGDPSYISVNIVAPNGPETRGIDGGFEDGSPIENKAEKGTFLFFDASGNPTQAPQTVDLTWSGQTSQTPAVEKISEAVLVIAGNTAPSKVLPVLNPPASADFANKTIQQVRSLIDDHSSSTEGTFIITNSTYLDGTQEICAADIAGKTHQDKQDALDNPVDIYVERVVAKVKTSALPNDFTQGAEITIDGVKYTLTQEISGIEVANVAEKSYLFKSIEGYENWAAFTNWNDAANHRSYWAASPADLTYGNKSWNDAAGAVNAEKTFYVQENTTAQKTAVLVTATLQKDGTPFTFLKWAGSFYAKDNFLTQYAQMLKNANYRVKEGSTIRTFEPTDLDWLTPDEHKDLVDDGTFKGYEMTAKVKNNTLTVVIGTDENAVPSTVDAVNVFLKEKEQRCWLWEEGKCYYFADIEHFGTDDFSKGIVRNHIYDLTLNSLKGIGTPVFNPDETIIPEKPTDDLWYLAARINILKWKIVKQTVDFE